MALPRFIDIDGPRYLARRSLQGPECSLTEVQPPPRPLGRFDPTCRRGSIQLGARELDHFAPLLSFLDNKLAKICGRTRKRRSAHVGKPRFHPGIAKSHVDFFVELIDDFGGSVLRHSNAIP